MTVKRIPPGQPGTIEWLTLFLIISCYALLAVMTTVVASFSPVLAAVGCAVLIAFHSSLQHEVIHGHPLPSRGLSETLVFPAVGLFIPYLRFRDTHLQHHYDPNLTDPYEDPETNYLDPVVWKRLPAAVKPVLRFNNSLLGRMLLGPLISQIYFMAGDWRLYRGGDGKVARHWLLHILGAIPVLAWVWAVSPLSVSAYVAAAYGGLALLKIRTFLEHQAHERPTGRTAVIADRGPLALLFLNNNYHLVHHMNPSVAWHRLPAMFEDEREKFLNFNDGYLYNSYAQVFAKYFFAPKDPVPHPLWPSD